MKVRGLLSLHKPWHQLHLWEIQPVRDVLLFACLLGLFVLGEELSVVTVPMLVALGLAYSAEPFIRWLEQRSRLFTRMRIIAGVCVGLLGALTLVLVLLVPLVFRQASGLIENRERYATTVQRWAHNHDEMPDQVQGFLLDGAAWLGAPALVDSATASASDTVSASAVTPLSPAAEEAFVRAIVREELANENSHEGGQASHLRTVLANVSGVISSAAVSLIDAGMFLFLIVFFFVVFSLGFAQVSESLLSYIPSQRRERWLDILRQMDGAISGFIRGRLSIAAITGFIYAVGWSICGVPFAVLIGLGVGFIGIIPYASLLGLIGAYILLAVELLAQRDPQSWYTMVGPEGVVSVVWWKVLLYPGIVYMVVQMMDDYVLTPFIQGNATKLNTPVIVAAVIAGGTLGGLFGMLLAIPVAACLRIVLSEVVMPSVRDWLDGRRSDPIPVGKQP